MQNYDIKEPEDLRVSQIIDANLDRAREGLRVLEDWARFGLSNEDLVIKIKNFRQILGKSHLKIYKKSRNFIEDQCKGLSHKEQFNKKYPQQIISSNSARVQEALRVIEEFTIGHNYKLSKIASKIRYETYNLEVELINLSIKKNSEEIIQHRFKGENDKDHLQEAIKIKKLCERYNSLFIVNDRIDIALATNADGLHLGQDDVDLKTARKLLGCSKIIGISANNEKDISNAIENGCDYLGIGPVFKTSTKKEKQPLGLEKMKIITKDIKVPWFAIGGINKKNISNLKKNGFKKVAIISDLMNSENPKREAIMILKELSHEN